MKGGPYENRFLEPSTLYVREIAIASDVLTYSSWRPRRSERIAVVQNCPHERRVREIAAVGNKHMARGALHPVKSAIGKDAVPVAETDCVMGANGSRERIDSELGVTPYGMG
jgi:hypothetical protein